MQVPRLELILGHRLAQLDWEAIESIVRRNVSEDTTLDFKRELYADGKDLAKDLAAMATSAGGLIVLGVTEDEHGRAATRYMHEPELASRYRDRAAGAARQLERLEQANQDGVSRRSPIPATAQTTTWSCIPTAPASPRWRWHRHQAARRERNNRADADEAHA